MGGGGRFVCLTLVLLNYEFEGSQKQSPAQVLNHDEFEDAQTKL